jgi:hypothetical protein
MTKTMTTRKLYGRDLSEYENMDVDELLTHLSPEELDILSKEVDPDVRFWFSFPQERPQIPFPTPNPNVNVNLVCQLWGGCQ